ncbi:MAG TPA: NUDIX domain-containing protein [Candidatus Saccharimonadales bacterium]|nr:NUDIX domain-containing protein [Candidatus Saccharimonadales bacterium]
MNQEFLPARATILYHLRHVSSARYSDLRRAANMESDTFKFHVRYLVEQGIIAKQPDGSYVLTVVGKETANNLNESAQTQLKQPKVSLLLVISRPTPQGTEYLMQKRLRQPFYGYWGLLSGPAQWGQDFTVSAAHELRKQTGLAVDLQVSTFLRQRDYTPAHELLEDKLFVLLTAQVQNQEPAKWKYGENAWMTLAQLREQPQYFSLTTQAIQAVQTKQFVELSQLLPLSDY